MENLKNFAIELEKMELKENKNIIQQTQRNVLRGKLLNVLLEDLKANEFDVSMTEEGIALELANDELGSIFIVLKPIIKGTDYDIESAVETYEDKQKAKAEKERKKKERESK